jgi:hypothetical protein
MSFWKRQQDPEAVPSAVPAASEGGGWWTRLKDRVGLNEPEEIEMAEPSLLQQVTQATTLNRTQVQEAFPHLQPLCRRGQHSHMRVMVAIIMWTMINRK